MKLLDAGMINTTEKHEKISSPVSRMEFSYVRAVNS